MGRLGVEGGESQQVSIELGRSDCDSIAESFEEVLNGVSDRRKTG